jgi:hypothetical protein
MEDVYGALDKDTMAKCIINNKDRDVDYLKENCVVVFINIDGPDAKKIQFSTGCHLLGYSRK